MALAANIKKKKKKKKKKKPEQVANHTWILQTNMPQSSNI